MALSPSSTTLPPAYVYKPLLTSTAAIRLLKIHNEISSFDDPIFCDVLHFSLYSMVGLEYTSLSYVWGKPIFDQTIYCDGCVMKVTSHLQEAMRTLRSRRVGWVWIDAICIDQSNIAERNTQVSIMGCIYKLTQMTFVYLGNVDKDGEKAARLIIRLAFLHSLLWHFSQETLQLLRDRDSDERILELALQDHPCASERERKWFSQWRYYCMAVHELREFTSQEETDRVLQVLGLTITGSRLWRRYADLTQNSPWFGRGWVIQEAVLSPHVRFLLGSETVDLRDITQSFLFTRNVGLINAGIKLHGSFGYIPGEIMELKDRETPRCLKQLLRKFRQCKTSDRRDKIYSLLGLADDLSLAAPKPDYHQSEENVFSSYARYLIQHQHQTNLDILIDAGTVCGSTQESGTWVPRWDATLWGGPLLSGGHGFSASGATKSAFSFVHETSLLVRGVVYDKLCQLEAETSVFLDDESWYTWERRVSGLAQQSPKFSAEVYARALIADFCGYGTEHFNSLGGPSTHFLTFNDLYEQVLAGHSVALATRKFKELTASFTKTHAFVLTHKGNLGWVPRCTEEGDLICIIFGVPWPLLVREIEEGQHILIGGAYIDGIMHGEALKETDLKVEDLLLV